MTAIETAKPLLANTDGRIRPQRSRPSWQRAAIETTKVAALVSVVGTVAAWPVTIPAFVGAAIAAAGLGSWRRSRQLFTTGPVLEPAVRKGATARRGVAHKLDGTISSIVDGAPVLVEEATLLLRGGVVFRRIRAIPFVLAQDEGARAVVTGVIRVAGGAVTQPSPARDPRLGELGIPPKLRIAGQLETRTVRDGDAITVTGDSAVEIVPELAFHRDAGATTVIRGRAHSVALID
jgi:hypothetical protein